MLKWSVHRAGSSHWSVTFCSRMNEPSSTQRDVMMLELGAMPRPVIVLVGLVGVQ